LINILNATLITFFIQYKLYNIPIYCKLWGFSLLVIHNLTP